MPDLELPDGRIIQDIPDGLSKEQIATKLIGAGILTGKEEWLNESAAKFKTPVEQRYEMGSPIREQTKIPYNIAKGIGTGLGRALIGGVQAATDIGEAGARGIEKAIYGDIIPQQTFGSRLAQQVEKLEKEDEKLPTSERLGIAAGEIAPYVGVGAGMGIVKGSAAASALASFLSPEKKSDLEGRAGRALEAGVEGALIGGALKQAGNILSSQPVQKTLEKAKEFTTGLKNRIASQFGSDVASKTIAEKAFKKGFEAEGINARNLLDNLQENNLDLIDALDPRFATYAKVKGSLTTPENIKKVDASLANIKQSTDDLQKSLTNMVATKQLTPEEAGQVLGRNSKKIFDRAIEARKAKADPLYVKGLSSGTKIDLKTPIPLDSQTKAALGVNSLTLDDIVNSKLGEDIINAARGQAAVFAKTPGGKFYGQLDQKTKPVFEKVRKLAGTDVGGSPIYKTEEILKEPSRFKIPNNDVRTLYAMENVLADRIGNIKLTGASKEEAALIATKKAISDLLNKANPDLQKARSIWSADTQNIMGEGRSLIGKFAKMYDEGRADELAKASMNILNLPDRAIKLARKSAPDEFNQVLRSSIENKLAAIKPLDDSVINPRPFYSALFPDKGKSLKTALNDNEIFEGFKKLAIQLDRGVKRQTLARGVAESQAKAVNIATGKTSFINRILEKAADRVMNSPNAQKKMVDYGFTDEGIDFLKKLSSKDTSKTSQKALISFLARSGIITRDDILRSLAVAGGYNDIIDIIPESKAMEPTSGIMSEDEVRRTLQEQKTNNPSIAGDIDVEAETQKYKKRYLKGE